MDIPQELLSSLKNLQTPYIIGISGFGGSGKSTLARELSDTFTIPTISIDSFMKDGAFDTEYKVWEIMDFKRLEKEVIKPFVNNQKTISYRHFVPTNNTFEKKQITNIGKLILEGVGLFRPELMKYFTYSIWVDCPIDIAIERGKKRDRDSGAPTDELWDGIWRDNDMQYSDKYTPETHADFVIHTK